MKLSILLEGRGAGRNYTCITSVKLDNQVLASGEEHFPANMRSSLKIFSLKLNGKLRNIVEKGSILKPHV